MANVKQNPSYRAKNKYYGHDLSQHLEFTSPTGQLLPVYYDVLNPGEKVSINTYMKTRTQPLASAAMMKMNEYLEWYFVPINQIYKPFGNWFFGIQDFDSSLFVKGHDPNTRMSSKFPYITLNGLHNFYLEVSNTHSTIMDESYLSAFIRLCSHLGVPDQILTQIQLQDPDPVWSITPLLFCAYQKIYMDHYRLSDRLENDPRSYNLDKFFDLETDINPRISDSHLESLLEIFRMRYRPLRKDFYTNNYPSPLFGSQSVGAQSFISSDVDSTLQRVNQWLTNLDQVHQIGSDGSAENSLPTQNVIADRVLGGNLYTYQMNQANIRTLFAADKLLEITRRSGKHYDAQTLAHFGVEVPTNIEGQSYYLGRSVQEIVVGDVISNAATEDAPLGEIAGKGYSVGSGKTIKFDAPCHGVLMCIYSSAPVVDYYQEGLDKLNCLIRKDDYFLPEYDNLGPQPLFGYQSVLSNNLAANSSILGWQYRYFEYKQKMNRIIGGLKHTQKHWTVGIDSSMAAGYYADRYYVSPGSLDSIMLYKYNFGFNLETQEDLLNPSQLFESDPLMHEVSFDVRKASEMSTFGLMEL